ncbi:MAG: Acetylxylan esterase [Desulfovibrio sp.]
MTNIFRVRLREPESVTEIPRLADDVFVTEIPEPELHIFPADPARNTGIGAILCPGGGYAGVAMGPEGHACAAWLASVGVTGMVLQYRLPGGNKTIPLEDARLAFAYARANGERFGIQPGKLGVIGFSAGGHLASLIATDTQERSRPAFSVLFYPVISMAESKRGVTRINLLGQHPEECDLREYSTHMRVTESTPPALLFLCDDDPLVPPGQSVLYYEALKGENVPASMHIFPKGGHAWGFRGMNNEGETFRYDESVRALLLDWLLP